MADKTDDLEAVRKLVEVLSAFDAEDQERIIRWAREKQGLPTQVSAPAGMRGWFGKSQRESRDSFLVEAPNSRCTRRALGWSVVE